MWCRVDAQVLDLRDSWDWSFSESGWLATRWLALVAGFTVVLLNWTITLVVRRVSQRAGRPPGWLCAMAAALVCLAVSPSPATATMMKAAVLKGWPARENHRHMPVICLSTAMAPLVFSKLTYRGLTTAVAGLYTAPCSCRCTSGGTPAPPWSAGPRSS